MPGRDRTGPRGGRSRRARRFGPDFSPGRGWGFEAPCSAGGFRGLCAQMPMDKERLIERREFLKSRIEAIDDILAKG